MLIEGLEKIEEEEHELETPQGRTWQDLHEELLSALGRFEASRRSSHQDSDESDRVVPSQPV
jgi:hypothetical protein